MSSCWFSKHWCFIGGRSDYVDFVAAADVIAICSRGKSKFREVSKSKSCLRAQKRCKSSWQAMMIWDCGENISEHQKTKKKHHANLIDKGLKLPGKENPGRCFIDKHVQRSWVLWSFDHYIILYIFEFYIRTFGLCSWFLLFSDYYAIAELYSRTFIGRFPYCCISLSFRYFMFMTNVCNIFRYSMFINAFWNVFKY